MKKKFDKSHGHKKQQKSRQADSLGSSADEGSGAIQRKSARKKRHQIKNARSLKDVLGLGDGSGKGRRSQHRQAPAEPPMARRGNDQPSAPARPSKLTYIMNFQPPPSPQAKGGARPEPGGRKPAREPEKIPSLREVHTRADYRWPETRLQAPPSATEPRSRAKGSGAVVRGIMKRHPDGFGFLIPDDPTHPDVYVSRQSMTGIMTNDRVEVSVYKPKGGGKNREDRLAGEIVSVISRAHTRIVGKYLPVDQKYGVILDENRSWGADLRIAAKDSLGANEGDLVAVEVLQYPGEDREFIGRVTGLIGNIEDPLNDVIRVVHQSGIPTEFSATALAEAKRFGGQVSEHDKKGREDLTHLPIITIDGVTAKDFDDAISVEQTDEGFHLVVAIADVSHYVKPGSKLDEEAYQRGTSTYFPNYVVPMLPEELSNELCSLKPNVDRLCFVCDMRLSFSGDIHSFRFYEGVMRSKARVTYGEAQEVIEGRVPERLTHVADNILRASDLAKILMQKRFREGSLDLEIPETQVVVDLSGETSDIIRSERLFAHRLIEELMLVTNICTARFLDEAKIPGVYRIHEEPEPDNIRALQRYLWNFGGSGSLMGTSAATGLQKKLTKALQTMEGKPEAQVLNILTLRTMKQAHYSQDNVGHFGLGFTHYTHFTSPIRRYPDLIAHRLIKSQLYDRYKTMQMSEAELASATTFLSACEQRSVKAERQVISIKKARFIKRFVGQEFDGIISSVTKFGVFVLLRQYDVDGLVKIEYLGNDRFVFDDENLRLIGQRTGVRYTIGDAIRVLVVGADVNFGKVDFELVEPPAEESEAGSAERFEFADEREALRKDQRPRREPQGAKSRKSARGKKNDAHESRSQKGKGLHPQKRSSSEDDRRGVRKERVSKRRRKN